MKKLLLLMVITLILVTCGQTKGTSKKVLGNDVLKDVDAIKNNNIINLDAKSWYFSSGGIKSTTKEIQQIAKKLQEQK
ncbi:hypothetical protein MUA77_12005 [Mammaliicoccus sciuri]|uniref:hypothetical protein n=1 Tax=Mammaliicoccus sciuri TaxID=1296 RepID=UPI0021D38738|nr:hypothetical protein [Mammaliicoccus sciuri]UXU83521.1 hypothetical protein MUA77_12005 [Mammaliicoccus sciuri]UXU93368.1 hypothetical protein MUA42_12015 [Mammaliicoccus sciuri]UXV15317.1 hypothetical protein MUA89_12280 [Mammaliicoccus sciuri]UXV23581.1 hypothetical protein MUA49_12010 [Mammaliicoccus sciuri]UXV26360.1 hypothetical protein MUA96_12265 [Mammaliicoccus sciuri]